MTSSVARDFENVTPALPVKPGRKCFEDLKKNLKMPRLRDNTRKLAVRQEADREEKVNLAKIKMDAVLLKVDEIGRRHMEIVDSRIKLIRDTTDEELLNMKWSEFLALGIDKFADYQGSVSTSTATTPRSRSVSRKPAERTRLKQRTWTRVQSVDRKKLDEIPSLSFQRWPRAGEAVLSRAASPLAVPLEERCANVQIPTSKGTITVKPHKMMNQVKREVLKSLDQNTLAQVKMLNANLGEIVNMATKMGKL